MHALDDSPVYLYDTSTILRPGRLSPCKRHLAIIGDFLMVSMPASLMLMTCMDTHDMSLLPAA